MPLLRKRFSVPALVFVLVITALFALPRPGAAAASDSIAIGRPAPDFSLPDQDGKRFGPKDFAGHWLVLYFYPKDFTGGCTLEAHNFQKDSAKYAAADANIVGVSLDTPGSHKDFCAKEGLRFKLLADSGGVVSARYGSLHNILGKKLSARNTFLVDPQGNVAMVFKGVKPAVHSDEVLAALSELRKP
jgi:thioredoxin-dependent peroxiredoxin